MPHSHTLTLSHRWFVVDPADGLVKHVDPRAELGDSHVPRLSATGWPSEAGVLSPERARQPRTLQALLQEMRLLKIGPQLKAAGSEALVDAEVIAARLYTGPLYIKYSSVLRGLSRAASGRGGDGKAARSSDDYARAQATRAQQQVSTSDPMIPSASCCGSLRLAAARYPL